MIRGELMGHKVEISGVPVLTGARQISNAEGKKGFIFDEPAEHKALLRWQVGDFNGAEILLADAWRYSTQSIDLEGMQRTLRTAYSDRINLRTLAETATFVDELIKSAPPLTLLSWFFHDARVVLNENEATRIKSFQDAAAGALSALLPYTSYCLRAALIFHFGLAFGLVSTRPTCRLDLEYLYYAPFCHVFSSADKFHRKMADVIARDQMFVAGHILKADLANLVSGNGPVGPTNQSLDEGYGPPQNPSSVTHQAWMKTMKPGFRDVAQDIQNKLTPEKSAQMFKRFQQLMKSNSQRENPLISMDECEFIIMEHNVRPDGPCICGSTRLFKDCCGRELVAARQSSGVKNSQPPPSSP